MRNAFSPSFKKGRWGGISDLKNNYKAESIDLFRVAKKIGIKLPKNLGDVIYSFRYRAELPESVKAKAPSGREWIIRPAGRSKYAFVATFATAIQPTVSLVETKIDEQVNDFSCFLV